MQKPKFLLQRSLKKKTRKKKPYIWDRYWSMVGSSCENWQKKWCLFGLEGGHDWVLKQWWFLRICVDSVTKGVRELPGNVQAAASFVPSRQAVTCFAIMTAAGVFFILMAFFMFLPVIVLFPQKFAISFTLGCLFIIGSFFALKGPKTQFLHMISKEVCFISSILGFGCHLYICKRERENDVMVVVVHTVVVWHV